MDINELREMFEDNFEELKFETGRSITPSMKEFAWQQVMLYYEKLNEVAMKITETEVNLTLPEQVTPKGKKYTIKGVVDIVKEEDKIIMYDIKTHNCNEVKRRKELYKGQLNVYAHIWKNLRDTEIDNMAIIATAPSVELRDAIFNEDKELIIKLIEEWNPIVELPFDKDEVEKQIQSFGATVDNIEDREFKAPSLKKLKEIQKGQKTPFGTAVCRHCDARHSCSSYEKYIDKVKLNEEIINETQKEDTIEQDQWKDSYLNL